MITAAVYIIRVFLRVRTFTLTAGVLGRINCTARANASETTHEMNARRYVIGALSPAYALEQGFPTRGTRTTSGIRKTRRWYAKKCFGIIIIITICIQCYSV
uniref:Secreted protein n=1 Tax=Sipha flava TaxID=143950 RepID=A0A2S2Q368_9HEMI